jgi:hypothetical protein
MNKKVHRKKRNWRNIISNILFIILVMSIIFTIVRIVQAPSEAPVGSHEKVKSDYVLTLLQCILGLIVMFIPTFVEHKWSIDIPNKMEIAYFIFLYCAIYLGEVHDFYYVIPHWDTILHAFSGATLGALGFFLVSYFNDAEILDTNLSPFFIAFFAFCFALAAGVVWEIYEFLADFILKTNMQKFILADGTVLQGQEALLDTMEDLIVDAISAFTISAIGYFSIKRNREM